ncbi:unnamed protein product [Penicillium salamii]|nr:unnamed protein product [Penicillium salamii]CAG8429355.1 unnamed protein product [Penicillium salamii]
MHQLSIYSAVIALSFISFATALHNKHDHWNELRDLNLNTPSQNSRLPILIDTFENPTHNNLGSGMAQFDTNRCYSLVPCLNEFLHVVFEGTDQFSVSLNQHNDECNPRRSPFPSVADSVQAERYVMHPGSESSGRHDWDDEDVDEDDDYDSDVLSKEHLLNKEHQKHLRKSAGRHRYINGTARIPKGPRELYIPLTRFEIDFNRVVSVSFHGFYTPEPMTLHLVEIVPTVPSPSRENGFFRLPGKLPSGRLVLRCSRPNSFAFGIDDGQPQFSQRVMRILDEEGVRVTFFVVGTGLRDRSSNFTEFYKEMLQKGHQVALHSNTHPKMESLQTVREIDEEIIQMVEVFKTQLGIECTWNNVLVRNIFLTLISASCFRPPFGTVAARLRQQLARHIPNPYIVNWSVDVEDWLWANTSTPEKQLDAFYRGVDKGGNLAVMHYLNPTTIEYLPKFIQHIKSAGYQIMRIDQCLEDVSAPPL